MVISLPLSAQTRFYGWCWERWHIMATEIANTGIYAVLPRTSTIESAMREHSIQRSGITDPASVSDIRRLLQIERSCYLKQGFILLSAPSPLPLQKLSQ